MQVGIDAISAHIPPHYFPVRELAVLRQIDPDKLEKGLGLSAMSLVEPEQDATDLAAQALIALLQENPTVLPRVGRIYMGSESHVDGAKPTLSYALSKVETALGQPGCFNACDVVDMTFACIAGVDAMLSCVEYVRLNPDHCAIAVASDLAIYSEGSAGEYTQGAAAVAVLISANPRLLVMEKELGIGYAGVEDFHKPLQRFQRAALAQELGAALNPASDSAFWSSPKTQVWVHSIEPVFDGPYSNACYTERLQEALTRYENQCGESWLQRFDKMAFHLPYAFQGRRMGASLWLNALRPTAQWADLMAEIGPEPSQEEARTEWEKKASKSQMYRQFVAQRMLGAERASSAMGNGYTASIFIALLGIMAQAITEQEELSGRAVGFLAYGSGSKGKVFRAVFQGDWKQSPAAQTLWTRLKERSPIDTETYLRWHRAR